MSGQAAKVQPTQGDVNLLMTHVTVFEWENAAALCVCVCVCNL